MKKNVPLRGSGHANGLFKFLLVMKLAILFTLFSAYQLHAGVFGQTVNLKVQKTEIKKILNSIEKNGDVRFLYNVELPSLKLKVDFDAENLPLRIAMDRLFFNTSLNYKVLDNNLIVVMSNAVAEQDLPIKVTGRVTGENGEPLSGVNIVVKGGKMGTSTNNNGEYTITVDRNATLEFSFIGFESRNIQVKGENIINTKLTPSLKVLDQVVVVGYGSQKKRDITSAITTVDTKDISSRPFVSAAEALTGKAPGVQVTVPNGMPGSDLSIKIRGVGSPNGGEPLYVVDGVLANDIRSIDPNTIETISVLKDASAAGIYGAAGSTNGVVMITTKQGTKGKTKFDVNVYTGEQQITKKIPVLNNTQWLGLETEIFGTAPTIPSYYNLNTTNNNWQDMIYHNAMQTGVNMGLSGGSEKGTYYLGAGYLNQDGIMVGSNFERYSVKLSIDQSVNSWLKVGANISYNRSNQRNVPQNASTQNGGAVISALVTPEYIPVTMPANSPNPGVYGYSNFYSGDNPLSDIYNNNNKTIANNLLGNLYTEIKLPFNIKYRSQFNVILENSKYDWFLNPYNNLYGLTLNGSAQDNTSETFRWAWDNTLTYGRTFGHHSLNIVAGTSALDEKIAMTYESGQGFATSAVQTLNGASSNFQVSSSNYEWSTNSYFGRLMYAYYDKYLLTATLRTDGSSRVGINDRWGTFPAVSAGWKVSNEAFMKDVTWVQDLKIRAGWGETGNLPPYTMLYPSYSLLSAGSPYTFNAGSASPGISPSSQIGNPNLKWESAKQTNIGFDAGFLQNRVVITADYYQKKVSNMIFTEELPLTTGGAVTALNLPGYDINKGFEFGIDAAVIKKKDFDWNINYNMSFNKNVIQGINASTSFQTGGVSVAGSKAPIYTGIIKDGYSLGTFWGYQALGVNPQTGNMAYSANETSLGSALPKYTLGFTNTFRYKAFTLSLLIDAVHGNKVYDETRMETEALVGYTNESASVLARWEKAGQNTSIPTAIGNGSTNATNAALLQSQIASNYVEDGSFLRLRNATLAYQLDKATLKLLGISAAKFYFSAQNLFTITKYKGYYPELNGFGQGTNNQPSNAGSSASLMALGIDNGTYPAAKTFTLGINLQL